MNYLLNSFSAAMLMENLQEGPVYVRFEIVTNEDARFMLSAGFESRVGHASTAMIIESMIDMPVPVRREGCMLRPGDTAHIAQYTGPRLPEGAMSLPEGATLTWIRVWA